MNRHSPCCRSRGLNRCIAFRVYWFTAVAWPGWSGVGGEGVDVVGGEVGAVADQPQGVAVLAGLQGSVGGDLDEQPWLDLDERRRAAPAPAGADLDRPRVAWTGRFQEFADLCGLVVLEFDGATDDLEDLAAVSADDQHLGRSQAR